MIRNMKMSRYLTILMFSLFFASCITDKESEVKTSASQTSSNQAQTRITNQQNSPVSKPLSRPTENIKVNLPGQKPVVTKPEITKPAVSANVTKVNQDDNYNGLTEEEKRMTKEREKKMERLLRENPTPKPKTTKLAPNALPSACDLVTAEFVSKTLGVVEARDIYVKDGSGKKAVHARSCFFKWDDAASPNAGVLLQIQKNPVEEEFPDWASYYIRSKRDQGDVMPDGSGTYRYKDFPGMGIAGAYNYNLARYTWRTETDNIFMVAFNLPSSEAQQLIWAEKIGKEAMRNFAKMKN